MKVACENCSTRYSIDDDKVAGKVFKIRCRKCGTSIVLRGDPGAAAADAAAAGAGAGPAWHAVQDGRQIGPFDSGELRRRRAAGELDDESYVWREGFADWQPLGAVGELRSEAAPLAVSLMSASPAVSLVSAPPPSPAVSPSPAPLAGRSVAPSGAVDRGAEPGQLFGARRETSALFTLSSLAQLSTPSVRAPEGGAAGEGSGLIDIRALARSYAPAARPADAARPGRPAPASAVAPPELPVFTSGTFAAPSVLVPPVQPRDRRIVVGLVASFGLLAICATLLLVIVFTRSGKPATAGDPRPAVGPRVAAVERPAQPRAVSPAVIEAPSAPATQPPAIQPPATQPPAIAVAPTAQPRPPVAQPRPPVAQPRPPVAQPRPPAVQPRPPAPPAAAKCDQVTCIVNGYDSDCCRALQSGGAPVASGPTRPTAAVPENLDRAAIARGLATISMKRCGGASSATGLVKAQLKVSAAGAVTSVNVQSSPDAALSACVAAQAKQGRFQPTQRGASFSYVWRF